MQLSIAPKFVMRQQTPKQPAPEAELLQPTTDGKGKPSPFYALAVVVRIGVLGTVLFHAMTFWPW